MALNLIVQKNGIIVYCVQFDKHSHMYQHYHHIVSNYRQTKWQPDRIHVKIFEGNVKDGAIRYIKKLFAETDLHMTVKLDYKFTDDL